MKIENLKLKKLGLVLAALVFALGIVTTSVAKTIALSATKPVGKNPTPTVTPTLAPVNYFLAYPGILPDHPLYSVKMVRDRIWLWLTTDPARKSQLLLLLADKRLGASKALIEGGKVDLGVTTLTKGEKYLEQAINQALLAKKEGREVGLLLENLRQASRKHEEVILGFQSQLDDTQKSLMENILDYPRRGQTQLK